MNSHSTWMESHDASFGSFFAATAPKLENFRDEFVELMREYESRAGGVEDEVFLRFHVSDIARQEPELRTLLGERAAFVSVVGQAPAHGARVSLEAWHIPGIAKSDEWSGGNARCFRGKLNAGELVITSFVSLEQRGSYGQMQEEWLRLDDLLKSMGGDVERDVQRTWIYCRDIDNNYAGLVEARNDWFAENGMTPQTHFITSTGIEGQFALPERLVWMDSLAVCGLDRHQIEYLDAPGYLSPTHIYGVAFERGVRLVFGDGSLYFISGTASIDRDGEIVHPGDVIAQLARTLDNMGALMENAGGRLTDLKLACVYLRDMADADIVECALSQSGLAQVPRLLLKAPVCRPGWLVEIEAIASNEQGNSEFSEFVTNSL